MQYELSDSVRKVANSVIRRFHPDLAHKDIRYVMLSKFDKEGQLVEKRSKNGHIVMAEVETITGTKAFLISGESRTDENGPTGLFVIKVYLYTWNLLDEKEREAMLDEQLCQLNYNDETGAPSKGEYDALIFASNVRRFGLWNERIERVLNAAKELPLFAEQAEAEKAQSDVKVVKANGNGPVVDETPTASVSNLEPLKEQVAKKRGRSAAARAN